MAQKRQEADRSPLTRQRVLDAARTAIDEDGLASLSMRRLGARLGVDPMAIYHHVPNKEQILDGIVDEVFEQIELPPEDLEWSAAMRVRCCSAREVLARHPWAPPLMESRTSPGPATLGHHDAVLGCLRAGGLPWTLVAHAYAVLDSFVYGFALQEANLPFGDATDVGEVTETVIQPLSAEEFPNLVAFTGEHVLQPGYDFGRSFEFGLDLILAGLTREADNHRRHA